MHRTNEQRSALNGINARAWLIVLAVALAACGTEVTSVTDVGLPNDLPLVTDAARQLSAGELTVRSTLTTRTRTAQGRLRIDSNVSVVRTVNYLGQRSIRTPAVGLEARARALAGRYSSLSAYQVDSSSSISHEITEPATAAMMLCRNDRKWREPVQFGDGTIATSEGIGDAPAHRITTSRNGKVSLQEELTWVRRRSSWRLLSRTISDPSGSITEQTKYSYSDRGSSGARPTSGDAAEVDRVTCADGESAAAPTASRRRTARTPTSFAIGAGSTPTLEIECDDTNGLCVNQYREWQAARATHLAFLVAVGLVCATPAAAGCPTALAAAFGAAIRRDLLEQVYRECQAAWSAGQHWEPARVGSSDQPISVLKIESSSEGSTPRSGLTAGVSLSCTSEPGGGGGGGGGGGYYYSCHPEQWEISYDGGSTWEPIMVTVCEYLQM